MMQITTTILLWVGAIGCGVIGGLYFAFSTFIMQALGRIEPASGVAAMNAINATILGSLFMPLFWGSTLASLALALLAAFNWPGAASAPTLTGGILFVSGMFVVTVVFNVPLNNQLMQVTASDPAAAGIWADYLRTWTAWNHVRTIASVAASGFFIAALGLRANAGHP